MFSLHMTIFKWCVSCQSIDSHPRHTSFCRLTIIVPEPRPLRFSLDWWHLLKLGWPQLLCSGYNTCWLC